METSEDYIPPATPKRRLAFIPSGPLPPDDVQEPARPAEGDNRTPMSDQQQSPMSDQQQAPMSDRQQVPMSDRQQVPMSERQQVPMSERQQVALLLQMTSPGDAVCTPGSSGTSASPASLSGGSTPATAAQRRLHKRNERGETRLHVAAIRGDRALVRRLLSEGADVNATDYAGWTPLHEACIHGWWGVARHLVAAGADVNRPGLDRVTPLHDAAGNGRPRIVRLLLRRGADAQARTTRGEQPSDLAATPQVRRLLLYPAHVSDISTSEDEPDSAEDGEEDKENRPASAGRAGEASGRRRSRLTVRLSDTIGMESGGASASASDMYELKPDQERAGPAAHSPAGLDDRPAEDGKRPASQMDEPDADDAQKKKKKKGEDAAGKPPAKNSKGAEKAGKNGAKAGGGAAGKTGKGYSSGSERRSPTGSQPGASTPPKSKPASRTTSDDSDGEERREAGPKVPPLKIVINSNGGGGEQEQTKGKGGGAGSRLPYVVPSQAETDADEAGATEQTGGAATGNAAADGPAEAGSPGSAGGGEKTGTQVRITRSQRALQGGSGEAGSPESAGGGSTGVPDPDRQPVEEEEADCEQPAAPPTPVVEHPRKRKIRQARANQQAEAEDSGGAGGPGSGSGARTPPADPPFMNNYKAYQEIRRQVDRRRRDLFPITPKPPRGFKDYLINRATYVLAGNVQSRLSVPTMAPPTNLDVGMKELFVDQEMERYKLRLQHIIEKEKLVLTVEQEILRVHGRAARALANQALPFSACTILRDEEVYNLATPEQEEKDRNVRDRYNGRQFFSWLQDVDDKWEKIKEGMVLRHHNEAESLHAVQKMDWGWKLKEVGACDPRATPHIDELHVPMVKVIDDFDMPPS